MADKPETQWVLVDTISQFMVQYLVEVPVGKEEYALDTVVMNEAKEFSQTHLGEVISNHRVVRVEEALAICNAKNDYASGWSDTNKIDAFFTPMVEDK